MAAKFGRIISCDDGNSRMMSHGSLIAWSHGIMWKLERLVLPLPKGLFSPNLAVLWLMMWELTHNLKWPSDQMIMWGDVTNWKFDICSSVRSMIAKHGRLVTYGKRNHPVCKVLFCAWVIVLCLRENARIIFGYWLDKNCANFSWVEENFFIFRFSTFAISLSKFLFSVVKKVANIPLFLVFQKILHRL